MLLMSDLESSRRSLIEKTPFLTSLCDGTLLFREGAGSQLTALVLVAHVYSKSCLQSEDASAPVDRFSSLRGQRDASSAVMC